MRMRHVPFVLLALSLLGCATTPTHVSTPTPVVEEPQAEAGGCVGEVGPAPEGARPVEDAALLASALGEAGKGQLCEGEVFEVTSPVRVYRVWTASKPWSEVGRWWSLEPPSGTVEAYRRDNAICPEWSDLDRVSVCELVVGARFVMGPGQSATCEEGGFEASAVNQVFVDNDTRQGRVFVEGCQPVEGWPAP